MKANLRSLVEKTVTSLIPWLFITLIVFYFVYESVIMAGLSAIFVVITMFIVKRSLIKRKQKQVLSGLLELGEFLDDKIEISFDDNENWCSGIMELRDVKFFCMITFDASGLKLKLPTLFRRETFFVSVNNIDSLKWPEKNGRVNIRFSNVEIEITVPWKNSFDKFVSLK